MPKQQANIRGSIVDMDNRFNKIIPSFSPLNCKFSSGNFSNCFSFHSLDRESKNNQLHKLYNIILQALTNLYLVVVVFDASIKNYVVTLIAYVCS